MEDESAIDIALFEDGIGVENQHSEAQICVEGISALQYNSMEGLQMDMDPLNRFPESTKRLNVGMIEQGTPDSAKPLLRRNRDRIDGFECTRDGKQAKYVETDRPTLENTVQGCFGEEYRPRDKSTCDESDIVLQHFLQENAEIFWEWVMVDKNLHELMNSDRQQQIFFFKNPFPLHEIFYLKELRASKFSKVRQLDVRVREDSVCCLLGQYQPDIIWPIAGDFPSWRTQKAAKHQISCSNIRASKKGMPAALEEIVRGNSDAEMPSLESFTNLCTNYYDTGFCPHHLLEFARKQGATNNKRPRHMLCLETPLNEKVFLKWCTRCKKWKNFLDFIYSPKGGGAVSHCTHCSSCSNGTGLNSSMTYQGQASTPLADVEIMQQARVEDSESVDTHHEPVVVVNMVKNKFEAFLYGHLQSHIQKSLLVGLLKTENEEKLVMDALAALRQVACGRGATGSLSQEAEGQARVCLYLMREAADASSKHYDPCMPTQDQILNRHSGISQGTLSLVITMQSQYLLSMNAVFRKNILYLGLSLLKSQIEREYGLKLVLHQWKEGCLLFSFQIINGNTKNLSRSSNYSSVLIDQLVLVDTDGGCTILWKLPDICINVAEMLLGTPQTICMMDCRISQFVQLCHLYPRLHAEVLCRTSFGFVDEWEASLKDWKGNTPLHYAVLDSNAVHWIEPTVGDLISRLLSVQDGLFERNNQGFTPLEVAAILNLPLFEVLLEKVLLTIVENNYERGKCQHLLFSLRRLQNTLCTNLKLSASGGIAVAIGKALNILQRLLDRFGIITGQECMPMHRLPSAFYGKFRDPLWLSSHQSNQVVW